WRLQFRSQVCGSIDRPHEKPVLWLAERGRPGEFGADAKTVFDQSLPPCAGFGDRLCITAASSDAERTVDISLLLRKSGRSARANEEHRRQHFFEHRAPPSTSGE